MAQMAKEPRVSVGIVRSPSVVIDLKGAYARRGLGAGQLTGRLVVEARGGHAVAGGEVADGWLLEPVEDGCQFDIQDVEIGIGFHWDRRERQTFGGALRFAVEGDEVWAVNVIGVEAYLTSVISSEMSATSDLELLKAHAIASRSWLMAQVWGKGKFRGEQKYVLPSEVLTWRDREDHKLFDVCADDHCQRYQGLTRVSNARVAKAVEATRGLLLTYDGEVCDARFSKCCGGMTERFETCWAEDDHPYLRSFADAIMPPRGLPQDLTAEANARLWIEARPDVFCNTRDAATLRQVLNDYDQKTTDFFRWSVTATGEELGRLMLSKGGHDIGAVTALEPLRRGPSGRIMRLRVVGEKGEVVIGKELEIRRLLSPTHLYSSAFTVSVSDGVFTLSGAGWGHGVGLCQIGAAVMASKGFSHRSILYHYFRRALIEKYWA